MKKYEYKVITTWFGPQLQDQLNEAAQRGWRVRKVVDGCVILEREVEEKKRPGPRNLIGC